MSTLKILYCQKISVMLKKTLALSCGTPLDVDGVYDNIGLLTWIEAFVLIMKSLNIVIRKVEVHGLLNGLVRDLVPLVTLTQAGKITCPVDCETRGAKSEGVVVHVWM